VLKTSEITSIEREIKQLIRDNNVQQTNTHTTTAASSSSTQSTTAASSSIAQPTTTQTSFTTKKQHSTKKSVLDEFLESIADPIDKNLRTKQPTALTSSLVEEFRSYKLLAGRYVVDEESDPLLFWRKNKNILPLLTTLAKKYLAAPASSVASESTFSISANYLRKQRARLLPENLAMSVYLRDKVAID
jgi:hypothetical protein